MQHLNYQNIAKQFPWIASNDQNCVISPDSDGMLCALLMSHHFNWRIKGFYDGKVLLIEKGYSPQSVIYLDVEIYRKNIKSVGQHMLLPNKKHPPNSWVNLQNCISANNLREFDAKHDFQNKYPFGTIHLLVAILGNIITLEKTQNIIAPLLYTDGTFKNIFGYPENSLDWFKFLQAEKNEILKDIFFSQNTSLFQTMNLMKELFQNIKHIGGGRGGEKIKISNVGGGQSTHIFNDKEQVYISQQEVEKSEKILKMFGDMTGWRYNKKNWMWGDFQCFELTKAILENTTSFKKRNELLETNPLSFAITATNRFEYTKHQEKVFD